MEKPIVNKIIIPINNNNLKGRDLQILYSVVLVLFLQKNYWDFKTPGISKTRGYIV